MLTRKTFVEAIGNIKKHEELMDKIDEVCREFGDFRPSLDFGDLHLHALLDVLKEAMDDRYDNISWWLYEKADPIVSWEENGQEITRDLSDVDSLYDYLVEGEKARRETDTQSTLI